MPQVIYLTGAPASGKSSISDSLKHRLPNMYIFGYAEELRKTVRDRIKLSHNDIREKSSQVITRDDVSITDERLDQLVASKRESRDIIIDSHPITKESFGFRATPFSLSRLEGISPTLILCLYAETEVVRERIKKNPKGRPLVSEFECDFHSHLQASVAFSYGLQLNIPVYYLDSDRPLEEIVDVIVNILKQ